MDISKKAAISACVRPLPVRIDLNALAIEVFLSLLSLSELLSIFDISEMFVLSGFPIPDDYRFLLLSILILLFNNVVFSDADILCGV